MARFPFHRPVLGSSAYAEVADGLLVLDHPALSKRVGIRFDEIAGAGVHARPGPGPLVVLARDVRRFDLVSNKLSSARAFVAFVQPHPIRCFRFGADEVFELTTDERKHGIEVDLLGLGVEDAAGFVAALAAEGVRTGVPAEQLLAEVAGVLTGEAAAQRRREGRSLFDRIDDRVNGRRWITPRR